MKKRLSLIFTFFLAGCASMYSERVACPKTAILAEFSKSLDFPQGIPIRTEMDSLIPKCTDEGNQTAMDLRLRLTSLRPLENSHKAVSFTPSYFVAVVEDTGHVLSRSNHDLDITLEENQTTKVSFVRIQETFPPHKHVSVYIGFNLDEAQLKHMRKERDKNSF